MTSDTEDLTIMSPPPGELASVLLTRLLGTSDWVIVSYGGQKLLDETDLNALQGYGSDGSPGDE